MPSVTGKLLRAESKAIVVDSIDKLTSALAESLFLQLAEDMSPNDPAFSEHYDALIDDAQAFIIDTLEGLEHD